MTKTKPGRTAGRKRTSTPTYFEIEITHEDVLADLLWPGSAESSSRPSVDGTE